MTSEPKEINNKQWVIENLSYISVYFITTGSLYLWAYWSHFYINILEYLDITDIIKVTAFPIAFYAVAIGVGTYILDLAHPNFLKTFFYPDVLPPPIPSRFFDSLVRIIFLLLLMGIILVVHYSDRYWTAISLTAGLMASYIAYKVGFFKNRFTGRRRLIVLILVSLPFISWGVGKQKAHNLSTGLQYVYLISDFSKNYPALEEGAKLRYIGIAGENLFLYNPVNRSVIVAKPDDEIPLELKKFDSFTPIGELIFKFLKLAERNPPPRDTK